MKGYFEIGDSVEIRKPGFVIGDRGRQIKTDGARAIITGFGSTILGRRFTEDLAAQGIYKDRRKVYLRLFQDGSSHLFGADDLRLVDEAEQRRREAELPDTAPLVRLSGLPNTPFWEGDEVAVAGMTKVGMALFAPWRLSETWTVHQIHYEVTSQGEWNPLYVVAHVDRSGKVQFDRVFTHQLQLVARGPIWYRDHPNGA